MLAGRLVRLYGGLLHIADTDKREATGKRLSGVTGHVVDEGLCKSRWSTFGVHVLNVPEFVGIALGKSRRWRTAIDGEQGQARSFGCSQGGIANGTIGLGDILHDGSGAVTGQAGGTRNGLWTAKNIFLEGGAGTGARWSADDHDFEIWTTNLTSSW